MTRPRYSNSDIAVVGAAPVVTTIAFSNSRSGQSHNNQATSTPTRTEAHPQYRRLQQYVIYVAAAWVAFSQTASAQLQHGIAIAI